MALSGEVRFIIGAQMSESAREMVKASLPRGLSDLEKRRQLFERFHGDELRHNPIADLISAEGD